MGGVSPFFPTGDLSKIILEYDCGRHAIQDKSQLIRPLYACILGFHYLAPSSLKPFAIRLLRRTDARN